MHTRRTKDHRRRRNAVASDRSATSRVEAGPLAIAFAIGALACGGGGSTTNNNNNNNTNHPPTVSGVTATPSPVLQNGQVQLTAQASDADNDSLTYSWTQTSPASPVGAFSSTTGAATSWTAPTVATATAFTLAVTVSDGKTTAVGQAGLYVKVSSDVSLLADVQPILDSHCTGCHGTTGAAGLDLTPGHTYASAVGVSATSGCNTEKRILPGDPDHSVMVLRMAGTSCGGRMPADNPSYFSQNPTPLATITSWITNGAPNN
jgi:hypothetical protein